MPENAQSVPSNSGVSAALSAGQALPLFERVGRPSVFSREDMNRIVTAINAFIKLRVSILSSTSTDGTIQPDHGELNLSDDGGILALYLGASGGSAATPMTIVSEQANYLTCHNAAGGTVYVAKPRLVQSAIYSVGTWTYADGTHTYTQTSVNTRNDAVTGGSTFRQIIWFPYLAGDVIYCDEPVGGTGLVDGSSNPIVYMDTNRDGRTWATQVTCCITVSGTPTTFYILVIGSAPYTSSI
jgi:hypothetical protein